MGTRKKVPGAKRDTDRGDGGTSGAPSDPAGGAKPLPKPAPKGGGGGSGGGKK